MPDCFAARISGTLEELEAVVRSVEHSASQEAAADVLRPEIELPGALRWLRRRVQRVHGALAIVRGLFAEHFLDCPVSIGGFASRVGSPVLPTLRALAAAHLAELPAPLGFHPRHPSRDRASATKQHKTGRDPPPAWG